MYRANNVVPRLCRQLQTRQLQTVARQPLRCHSNPSVHPLNWIRTAKNCDRQFNRGHVFDQHFRSILDEMGQMARLAFKETVEEIPRRGRQAMSKSEAVELKFDDKAFSLKMNMRDFKQEHVKIKIINNRLLISAKHEQSDGNGRANGRDGNGRVSREITREFLIPENIDTETMNAVVTDEGLLMVQGRVKGLTEEMEKVIEIQKE